MLMCQACRLASRLYKHLGDSWLRLNQKPWMTQVVIHQAEAKAGPRQQNHTSHHTLRVSLCTACHPTA